MARPHPASFAKREREAAKRVKRQEKQAARARKKAAGAEGEVAVDDETADDAQNPSESETADNG